MTLLKAGMRVCASQKEKVSFGPVMSSFGTRPLKNADGPSCRSMSLMILTPVSLASKFRFWMRVLITSNGADTISEALEPAIEATKFWNHVAEL